eukprot:4118267-Prymnesium_polylepis.1
MLGALRSAPARLVGPQAPRSRQHAMPAGCAWPRGTAPATSPPPQTRAMCAAGQHRRVAVDEPRPADVRVL